MNNMIIISLSPTDVSTLYRRITDGQIRGKLCHMKSFTVFKKNQYSHRIYYLPTHTPHDPGVEYSTHFKPVMIQIFHRIYATKYSTTINQTVGSVKHQIDLQCH